MAKKIRVLIADENPKIRKRMIAAFASESRIKVVAECSSGESAIKTAEERKPDIVLIDINISGIDDMSPTEIINAALPNVLVIVTFNKGEKKSLKKAMADGAREYIVKPFTADAIVDTVINLYDKDKKRREMLGSIGGQSRINTKPKIITVFGTKGGVGKSTIATNVAAALANKTNEKVVLLDLDLQFGDISVMMNLYPKRTIADLMKEIQSMDSELLEDYLVEHPSGLKVLAAPTSPEHAEYITSSNIKKILNTFLESYKYIVIDLAPTFESINLTVLDMSDKVFFVTTLDLPTIKNAKVGLHIMKSLEYDEDKLNLIINKNHRKYGISIADLEKVIKKKISYIIPEDNAVVLKSVNKGRPFVLEQGHRTVARSIMKISDFILGNEIEKKTVLKRILRR